MDKSPRYARPFGSGPGRGSPCQKSLYLRIYGWNAEQLKEDKVRYTTFDAFVSFRIGEIQQNDYGCNLRLSPTPVPDSSPTLEKDSEEEEEEQEHKKIPKGKDLQFSEYRKSNTITSCPVCRKTTTWQWNNSLTHAINQVKRSNNTELSKKCHGWLLLNHRFKF